MPRVAGFADRSAGVLRQVFGTVPGDFAFRLWDGRVVAFGADPPAFTVVIHAAQTFVGLMRDPTPLAFGEAYIDGAIDIDGDLFAAMHVANALEEIRLPLAERLRLLLSAGSVVLRSGPRAESAS
jgi:cyclopropane-fatty-acyl-phospholipid synthase